MERDPSGVLIEACVTGLEESIEAVAAGADRLELCRDLWSGGVTPEIPVLTDLKTHVSVPVLTMVRPVAGPFAPTADQARWMLEEIGRLRDAGAGGIVLGVLDREGGVDDVVLRAMVQVASPLPVTFHRAFDEVSDPFEALETLVDAGVRRVLTGGGPGRALDGSHRLAELVRQAERRIEVVAGGRIRGDHVRQLVEETGVRAVHARGVAIPGISAALRGAP